MAYFRIDYNSDALRRQASFEMLIPNDLDDKQYPGWRQRPIKTLFLLHGYHGKAANWIPGDLPQQLGFAVVMPTAENSFYLDGEATGTAYQTMVGVELVDYVRRTFGLANSAADTCIAGLSMGGFGALHTGLAYPETFGKIGALSSALIVHEVARMKPGDTNDMANYEYYRRCFGDLSKVLDSDNNPETLVRKLKAAKAKLPEMYIACGTEDFLIENNRELHRFLVEERVPHIYREAPGQHNMAFWSEHIANVVRWMFGEGDEAAETV